MVVMVVDSSEVILLIVSSLKDEGFKPRVKLIELEVVGKRLSRVQRRSTVSVRNATLIFILALSFTDVHTSQSTKTKN